MGINSGWCKEYCYGQHRRRLRTSDRWRRIYCTKRQFSIYCQQELIIKVRPFEAFLLYATNWPSIVPLPIKMFTHLIKWVIPQLHALNMCLLFSLVSEIVSLAGYLEKQAPCNCMIRFKLLKAFVKIRHVLEEIHLNVTIASEFTFVKSYPNRDIWNLMPRDTMMFLL